MKRFTVVCFFLVVFVPASSAFGQWFIVVLDRTGSLNWTRTNDDGVTKTRCLAAHTAAQEDLDEFFTTFGAGGKAAILTFTNPPGVTIHTDDGLGGVFVDQTAANDAMNAIPADACIEAPANTNMADALCEAFPLFPPEAIIAIYKRLGVYTDGGENASKGKCSGPSDTTDNGWWDAGTWQGSVWGQNKVNPPMVVWVRMWDFSGLATAAAGGGPPTDRAPSVVAPSDRDFLEYLATETGGQFILHADGDPGPFPPATFPPPPPSGIPTVSAWGIGIMGLMLLIGAKVYFSRRQALQT